MRKDLNTWAKPIIGQKHSGRLVMNQIAVVGGAGFIGTALARHLSKFFNVKILDIKSPPEFLLSKVEFYQCNLLDYKSLAQGLRDADLVIHAAIVQIPRINEAKRAGYEVNVVGTQNVCEVAAKEPSIKGLILAGSWHVIGERELKGTISEEFGFRPDKVEERARLYALCKILQETLVRIYDVMSEKIYGVIRMGTAIGEGMPENTAANLFITRGLKKQPLTPFRHSMHRPMLYVDVNDVCKAFEAYARKILNGKMRKDGSSLSHVVNVFWPEPITILELAETVRNAIIKHSKGKMQPKIEIVDKEEPVLFTPHDKSKIRVDLSKMRSFLGLRKLVEPRETIERLVKEKYKEFAQ